MQTSRKHFLKQSALLFGGSLLGSKVLADVFNNHALPDNNHPKDCSWNLKTDFLYTPSQIDVAYFNYSKNSVNVQDVQYEDESNKVDECHPGLYKCATTDYLNKNSLRYKVYFPKATAHNYTQTPLPVIVMFHASGLSDCIDYEGIAIENYGTAICS